MTINTLNLTSNSNIFVKFAIKMKTSAIIGLSLLLAVWLWLAWLLLSAGGVNLKNLLILAMTAIIIFVPLWKKYYKGPENKKK